MAVGSGWNMVLQCLVMALLGLLASMLIYSDFHCPAKTKLQYKSCEEFISRQRRLPDGFSSKTPYHFAAEVTDESCISGCKAVQVYGIFRHGTRFPTLKHINKWNDFASLVRAKLQGGDPTPLAVKLQQWQNPFTVEIAGEVSEEGLWEQYCLAERIKRRYPRLFNASYSNEVYSFRTTQKDRTTRSALAFVQGLFEGVGPLNGYQPVFLESVSLREDLLLRFFDFPCPLHDLEVTNNESLHEMINSFLSTPEMEAVVDHVQSLVDPGSQLWNMSANDVISMYQICIFEVVSFGQSIWCSLFSEDEMSVLEYYSDLKTYWKKGYGFDINWQRSLPLVNDILGSFRNYSTPNTSDTTQKVLLRFAHAETTIPLTAYFGLFKDKEPLLAADRKDRQFAVKNIAPFSGNVVFSLYECDSTSTEDQYQVRVLVNELPMAIPGCHSGTHTGMCPLKRLEEISVFKTEGQHSITEMCTVHDV